jgi:hypothetical protein
MNFDVSGVVPSTLGVSGFTAALTATGTAADTWTRVQQIRTYQEQVRTYLLAMNAGKPSDGYDELAKQISEEWQVLGDALTSTSARSRVLLLTRYSDFCPLHQISLPTSEAYKLKSFCVATAKNCCGRVLLWTGD